MWIDIILEGSGFLEKDIIEFKKSQSVVTNLINRFLKKVKVKYVSKIAICLYKEEVEDFFLPPSPLIGVVAIDKTYDISEVIKLGGKERKEKVLEIIETLVKEACNRFGWQFSSFGEVFKIVRSLDFENDFVVGKLKHSKNRKFKAGVKVHVQEDGSQISILLFDRFDKLIREFFIIKTHQEEFYYTPFLGKTKWLNNDEFVLSNRAGTINFKISIPRETVELYFTSDRKTDDQLIDDLLIASSHTDRKLMEDLILHKIKDITKKWE